MDHRSRLQSLLVERSLFMGEFTLSSGAHSSYYVDSRRTTMSAEGQYLLGMVAYPAVRELGSAVAWVGGLTLGADPIAYAIAHRSWIERDPIQAFTVRKRAKSHGTGSRIEGGLPPETSVVVVEDTLTSGASALEAVAAVESHGAHVLGVLALVDRGGGGSEAIRAAGHSLHALYSAGQLLEEAGMPA